MRYHDRLHSGWSMIKKRDNSLDIWICFWWWQSESICRWRRDCDVVSLTGWSRWLDLRPSLTLWWDLLIRTRSFSSYDGLKEMSAKCRTFLWIESIVLKRRHKLYPKKGLCGSQLLVLPPWSRWKQLNSIDQWVHHVSVVNLPHKISMPLS